MKGPDGFVQAYNAQAAVEPALQLIVAQGVTQQSNDKQQLIPMIERVKTASGQKVRAAFADSGYCSEENLLKSAKKKDRLIRSDGQASAQSTRAEQPPRTHPEIRHAG